MSFARALRRGIVIAASLLLPTAASATSAINAEVAGRYNISDLSCGNCHNSFPQPFNTDGDPDLNSSDPYFTNGYAKDLSNTITIRSLNGVDNNGNNQTSSTVLNYIASRVDVVEADYTPRITSAGGFSPTSTFTLAEGVTLFTVFFSAGKDRDGTSSTISQYSESGTSGLFFQNPGSFSIQVGTTHTSYQRGNNRRANNPYTISFVPVNGSLIKPTTSANLALNRASFHYGNLKPVAGNDTYTTPGDQVLTGNLMTRGTDYDPDHFAFAASSILTAQIVSTSGMIGNVVLNTDGTFTYTPPAVTTTTARVTSFTYRVIDAEGLASNTATVTITVEGVPIVNTAPVAQDDSVAVTEDVVASGNVLDDNGNGADSDPQGDKLTVVSQTDGTFGTFVVQSDGSFTYTPDANATGDGANQDTATYTISDGSLEDTGTVTFTFTPVNDNPVATANSYSFAGNATGSGNVITDGTPDSDPDQTTTDGLTATVATDVTLGSLILAADGSFTYTPPLPTTTGPRSDSFTYILTDTDGLQSAPATVSITVLGVANVAPVAQDDAFTTDEDTAVSGNVLDDNGNGADSDANGQTLSVALIDDVDAGTLTLNADGSFTYTPDANANGTDTFTYAASDGSLQDQATVTITVTPVNDPPVAIDDAFSTPGDQQLTENVLTRGDDDFDPDETGVGGLTVELVSDVGSGTLTLNGDGSFTFDPPLPASTVTTTTTFTYLVRDSAGVASNTATATITILGVSVGNTAPVAQDDSFAGTEDVAVTGNVLDDNGNGADSDVDVGDTLTVSLNGGPTNGTVALQSDGSFTYTPNANYNGTDSFTYDLSDGTDLDTATVTISLTAVNDPPVARNDTFSTPGDTPLNGNVLTQGTPDSDPDETGVGGLTAAVVTQPTLGTLVLNGDGSFTYTPTPPATTNARTDTFTYEVSDSDGATSNTATVTITLLGVTATNQPPVAQDDSLSVDEDTTLTGDVLADNGSGADSDPDGDTLTVSVSDNVDNGTLTLNSDGSFSYTPNANFNGTDSFVYDLTDGQAVDSATVTITVNPVNDPPIARNDNFTTPGTVQLTGNVLTQGTNDSDPDQTDLTGLTVALVSDVTLGTLTLNGDGTFTFDPPLPTTTTARNTSFTYTVTDSDGAVSNVATVAIRIQGVTTVNQPPVAQDDSFATDEDTDLTGNVLDDNGNGADSDPDGDTLSVTIATSPGAGTVTLNTDGSFTYSPDANANGSDSFTYTLSDGTASVTGSVDITVAAVNDAPVVDSVNLTAVNESQGLQSFDLLDPSRVSDADGDTLSVSNVSVAISAPTLTNPTQSFTVVGSTLSFDPVDLKELDNDENAVLTFSFDVSDGTAPAVTGTLTITIIGLDNGLGRIAGAYADTLRSRYNEHFGTQNQANASCHSCHNPGQVDADIDDVNDCTSTVFTPYGLALCRARDEGQPPLSDLRRRLSEIEPSFAPTLAAIPPLSVADDATVGTAIGTPLPANPGRTVDNAPSTVVDFLIYIASSETYAKTSEDGQFSVDANGQLTVAGPLIPGTHPLIVLPVNDAGQKDNAGNLRPGIPGFIAVESALVKTLTITVTTEKPLGVADAVTAEEAVAETINVLANDDGGTATGLTIATAPANGTATVNADLSVTYTSDTGFNGTDSFTYVATNTAGSSDPTTVTVAVEPAGAAIARDDSFTAGVDRTTTINVLANDTGTGISLAITAAPANGTARVVGPAQGTGGASTGPRIEYTPDTGFEGQDSLTYRASNAQGSTTATVTITVAPIDGDSLAAGTTDAELAGVARAMGDTCVGLTGATADETDLIDLCGRLASDIGNGANIDAALSAIRNEEALAARDAVMTNARATGESLRSRMRRYQGGGTAGGGIDVSQLNLRFGDDVLPPQLLNTLTMGFMGIDQGGWNPNVGMFLAGNIVFTDTDGTARTAAASSTTGNITAGIDFRVDETFAYGVALSFARTETDFTGGGNLTARSLQISVYGVADNVWVEGLTVSSFLTLGMDRFKQARAINFVAGGVPVNRVALADYKGQHLNLAIEVAYTLPKSLPDDDEGKRPLKGDLRVFAGLDFLAGKIDAYTETGAGGLNLAVQEQSFESLIATLGIDYTRPYIAQNGRRGQVYARLSANAELLDRRRSVTSRFAVAGVGGSTFTVTEPGRHSVFGEAELGALIPIGAGRGELELAGAVQFDKSGVVQRRLSFGWQTEVFGRDVLNIGVSGNRGRSGAPVAKAEVIYSRQW